MNLNLPLVDDLNLHFKRVGPNSKCSRRSGQYAENSAHTPLDSIRFLLVVDHTPMNSR